MSLRNRICTSILAVGMMASGAAVLAQTPSPVNSTTGVQQPDRTGLGRRRMRRRMGHMRLLSQLDLTDAQKQQVRSIVQNQAASTKTQREELRQLREQRRAGTLTTEGEARAKELRLQLREARKGTRAQMMNVLTAEQKAKLEEMIKTRRANHEKFGRRQQQPN